MFTSPRDMVSCRLSAAPSALVPFTATKPGDRTREFTRCPFSTLHSMEDHVTRSNPARSVEPWEAPPRNTGPSREVLERVFGSIFDDLEAPDAFQGSEGSKDSAGPLKAAAHASASDPPGTPG
jgi:hypothetical protein